MNSITVRDGPTVIAIPSLVGAIFNARPEGLANAMGEPTKPILNKMLTVDGTNMADDDLKLIVDAPITLLCVTDDVSMVGTRPKPPLRNLQEKTMLMTTYFDVTTEAGQVIKLKDDGNGSPVMTVEDSFYGNKVTIRLCPVSVDTLAKGMAMLNKDRGWEDSMIPG